MLRILSRIILCLYAKSYLLDVCIDRFLHIFLVSTDETFINHSHKLYPTSSKAMFYPAERHAEKLGWDLVARDNYHFFLQNQKIMVIMFPKPKHLYLLDVKRRDMPQKSSPEENKGINPYVHRSPPITKPLKKAFIIIFIFFCIKHFLLWPCL